MTCDDDRQLWSDGRRSWTIQKGIRDQLERDIYTNSQALAEIEVERDRINQT